MLWDVSPRRYRFRTDSWPETMPTTARAASVDLYMMKWFLCNWSQVAGDGAQSRLWLWRMESGCGKPTSFITKAGEGNAPLPTPTWS
jgi:hypothetical protein